MLLCLRCCDWVFLAGPDMQTLTLAKQNPVSYYVHIWKRRKYWMLTESDQNDTGNVVPQISQFSFCIGNALCKATTMISLWWKTEVGGQWEGFWEQLSRDVFIHTDTVNITVFRTVLLLWKVKWSSVDIPYRKTSKTWRQQVYVHVAIHRETTLRQ